MNATIKTKQYGEVADDVKVSSLNGMIDELCTIEKMSSIQLISINITDA